MKKVLIGLSIIMIFLFTGCDSGELLSDDFKVDSEQIISIIEEARENERDLSEEERELFDNFHDKYKYGQYFINKDEGYYEMNDLEKAILRKTITMNAFVYDHNTTSTDLASEKSEHDYYEEAKEELDKLLKVKNIKNLPKEYKGKYPTYEKITGVYPEKFKEDMDRLIELYDPIVNGDEDDINEEEWNCLEGFYYQYNGDEKSTPNEYEQDNKYYLVNPQMSGVINLSEMLIKDISEGFISSETMERFNEVKEDIEFWEEHGVD